MAGQETTSQAVQMAALHIGSISFGGLSVDFASWSIAGSAIVLLTVFLGRLAAQAVRTRRQDRGIMILIQAQLEMFAPRYRDWPQTSHLLRDKWEKDATFQPFSSRTTGVDRPYERHRDRLPLIMSPELYRDLLTFYEDDRHFDDARAAVLMPAFLTLSVDRRVKWLEFLDELAALQAGRCAVLLQDLRTSASLWNRLIGLAQKTPVAPVIQRDSATQPRGSVTTASSTAVQHPSHDGQNGSRHG